jgi:hypothetical protein
VAVALKRWSVDAACEIFMPQSIAWFFILPTGTREKPFRRDELVASNAGVSLKDNNSNSQD